jgi:hypothetical protein
VCSRLSIVTLASIFLGVVVAISTYDAAGTRGAEALFSAGDFTAAATAYANLVAADPKNVVAELGLARLDLYGNRLEDASRLAGAVLESDPQNQDARRILTTVSQRKAVLISADAMNVPESGVIVPFLEVDPLPLVQLVVNGRPANFILDTGGPDVVLDPDFATELRLKITNGESGVFAGGLQAEVRRAVVADLQVGPVSLRELSVGIVPSRGLDLFKKRKVDGVIGTVFLSRFLSTIDYPHRQLVLRPRNATPIPGTAMPMWLVGDHFIFARGSVNGISNQLFLIDSGMADGGFGPEERTIATAHVKTYPEKAQTGIGGAGPVKIIPVVADKLCLYTVCQSNVYGMYSPSGSPLHMFAFSTAGTVSHTYLKNYAVTLDFSSMRLILSP